ncbi:MAG: hydroxyacylglutathione hydrolase [Sulfuriferula sp.]|nr:hydroxyacylglutathione hydrolase [Sulfuriferula sp.]
MNPRLHISPIPAFQDNYIWAIHDDRHAAVVDPGDAVAVLDFLQQHQLTLTAILITHHHHDHVGGIAALLAHGAVPVYGPALEPIPHLSHPLREGQHIHLEALDADFQILDLPGHTLGHIAYYGINSAFCGDTLFGCGCGRLFEGTAAQMLNSLSKLARLPAATAVYCAHEYTLSNITFALTLEPDNLALQQRHTRDSDLRAHQQPTLPSTIAIELASNPFLRCHLPKLQHVFNTDNTLATFTAMRLLKDNF